jgi:hypothetical protein
MMIHQIILTKKPKSKTTMKKTIQSIKRKIILISFCINLMLCFASCAYFSAAETKMQEIRAIQRDAKEILETPNLTDEWSIDELENAVAQDLKNLEIKHKRKQVGKMIARH